jgi:hypothetical protein
VSDLDLSRVLPDELMRRALANLSHRKDSAYVVHHCEPVCEFGDDVRRRRPDCEYENTRNPLAAAFPSLWPYGVGGIEEKRQVPLTFIEHVRWALSYHDWRFRTHHSFPFVAFGLEQKRQALWSARLQMRHKDFDADTNLLSSITVDNLKQAEIEESMNVPISNRAVRSL